MCDPSGEYWRKNFGKLDRVRRSTFTGDGDSPALARKQLMTGGTKRTSAHIRANLTRQNEFGCGTVAWHPEATSRRDGAHAAEERPHFCPSFPPRAVSLSFPIIDLANSAMNLSHQFGDRGPQHGGVAGEQLQPIETHLFE